MKSYKKQIPKKKSRYYNKFIIFFLVCAFLCYSLIIKSSMSSLNCIQIANDPENKYKTFLYTSPNFECWTGFHQYATAPTGIVGIIVCGFLFPFFVGIIIKNSLSLKNKHKINYKSKKNSGYNKELQKLPKNNEDDNDFRFFTKDYKPEFYYWESIVFIHKLILNIFAQMNQWCDEPYLRMLNVLFLLIYFSIVQRFRPFAINNINNLEFVSLITAILTNVATIGISSNGIPLFLMIFFYVASIVANGIFFCMGIYLVIKYTKWKEMINKAKSNLGKKLSSFGDYVFRFQGRRNAKLISPIISNIKRK